MHIWSSTLAVLNTDAKSRNWHHCDKKTSQYKRRDPAVLLSYLRHKGSFCEFDLYCCKFWPLFWKIMKQFLLIICVCTDIFFTTSSQGNKFVQLPQFCWGHSLICTASHKSHNKNNGKTYTVSFSDKVEKGEENTFHHTPLFQQLFVHNVDEVLWRRRLHSDGDFVRDEEGMNWFFCCSDSLLFLKAWHMQTSCLWVV